LNKVKIEGKIEPGPTSSCGNVKLGDSVDLEPRQEMRGKSQKQQKGRGDRRGIGLDILPGPW
jgi:hypothetical protein